MKRSIGNDLVLGNIVGTNRSLLITAEERAKHLFLTGQTGVGKTSALESMIFQDISNWRKSHCPVVIIDPHAALVDRLVNRLAKIDANLPVTIIDLRQRQWTVAYNVLRQRPNPDPSVWLDSLLTAVSYVWNANGTSETPLFARWAGNVFRALYERGLTLVDSESLFSEKEFRQALTVDLEDKMSRRDWRLADTLNAKELEQQLASTINRLGTFIKNQTLRNIFGQANVSFDFGQFLEKGGILMVAAAPEGSNVSRENSNLVSTMLLADLWVAAQERGKRADVRPTYVYVDEAASVLSPTISDALDQARGYGLHLTLAAQHPGQFLDRGKIGRRAFNSIMENCGTKLSFRLSHEPNLDLMARSLFTGEMDLDERKMELFSTKVVGYREELRMNRTSSRGTSRGGGEFSGQTGTHSRLGKIVEEEEIEPNLWGESEAISRGDSHTWTESEGDSQTTASVLIPVFGKELSSVHWRTVEEQMARAKKILFNQKVREFVVRIVGESTPFSVLSPIVQETQISEGRSKRYLDKLYSRLPFALPSTEAKRAIADRTEKLTKAFADKAAVEPKTTRRKL